jgi:NusA family KH domain protein, archaeal
LGEITLDTRALELIQLFESNLGVKVKDVIEVEDFIYLIVEKGETYRLFKDEKKKQIFENLKESLKKKINVLDYDEDPEKFFRNLFYRYKVVSLTVTSGEKGLIVNVKVDPAYKASALGKGAKNLHTAMNISKRYFNVARIYIE